jgi:exopolysaccharide biosynthesis polyprenyl glycosylphosphotransferase
MIVEQRRELKQKGLKLLDLLLTAAAFGLAFEVKQYGLGGLSGLVGGVNYLLVMLTTLGCCAVGYDFFNLYSTERRPDLWLQFRNILKALLFGSALAVFFFYIFKLENISRLLFALFMLFDLLLLTASRIAIDQLQRWRCKGRLGHRHILVIGSLARACDLISFVAPNEELGYHLIGCLDPDPTRVGQPVSHGVMVVGTLDDFETFILNMTVDEVVFAMPLKLIDKVHERISFAEKVGVNVRVLPDWQLQQLMFQPEVASVYIEKFVGMPTMVLSSVPQKAFELFFKDLLDRTVAACGLLLLAPLFVGLAVAIKLTSQGPVFFSQERSGLNGRVFNLLKFRTMVANAEELKARLVARNEMDGPVFKMKNDPRITGIGRFLRKTSLDELPQLINILRGDMSLVGPRPPLPSEVKDYQLWQRRRLSMKPGLTCIWQVSGRNNTTFERWMQMDLEYIDHWSLGLDVKLLARTLPAMVRGTGH